MISGTYDRRRRALFWSTLASAALHVIILTLLFYAYTRLLITRGEKETIGQTEIVTVHKTQPQAPRPAPVHRHVRTIQRHEAAPAKTPHHELSRLVQSPAPPEPPRRPTLASKLERDTAGYAREVAALNRQNDPHAIPTIDPASAESASKSYSFAPQSSGGSSQGNGIITPVQSWRDGGQDCYYGRYEYTYPDGSTEAGSIVWPFCYDPGIDPFKEPPHPIPFPLPLPGYRLPAGTALPAIEKSVYQHWASGNGVSSSAP